MLLIFSSAGNWGYSYQIHRGRYGLPARKDAHDILDERYARGEITAQEHAQMCSTINAAA